MSINNKLNNSISRRNIYFSAGAAGNNESVYMVFQIRNRVYCDRNHFYILKPEIVMKAGLH